MRSDSSFPQREATTDYYRPTPFEIESSWVHGLLPPAPPLRTLRSPREALEVSIEKAIRIPPCYVLFSGGRDSSALLAVATAVSRRLGAPDPVPVTETYPDIPESDESEWQRLVIEHLRLRNWLRVAISAENDLLGPIARAGLLARGLVWPPAIQIKSTILGHVAGGSVISGDGGDEVLGPQRVAPVRRMLAELPAMSRRRARPALAAIAPRPARRAWFERRLEGTDLQPWIHEDVRRVHYRMLAHDMAAEPLTWSAAVRHLSRRRHSAMSMSNYALMAGEFGSRLSVPFLEPTFLAAFAAGHGRFGYASRTDAMEDMFGDLLPRAVIERTTKAHFNRAYVGDDSREFARNWDGSGVSESVDAERLRQEWLAPVPSAISTTLLQSAWLHSARREQRAAS